MSVLAKTVHLVMEDVPRKLNTKDNISPIAAILTWCCARIQNIHTAWCLRSCELQTKGDPRSCFTLCCTGAAKSLVYWRLVSFDVLHSASEDHFELTGLWIDISGGKTDRLRVSNFEESRYHDLWRYEMFPWWCWWFKSSGMWHCVIWQVAVTFWRIIVPLKIRKYLPNYTVPHPWQRGSRTVIFICLHQHTI